MLLNRTKTTVKPKLESDEIVKPNLESGSRNKRRKILPRINTMSTPQKEVDSPTDIESEEESDTEVDMKSKSKLKNLPRTNTIVNESEQKSKMKKRISDEQYIKNLKNKLELVVTKLDSMDKANKPILFIEEDTLSSSEFRVKYNGEVASKFGNVDELSIYLYNKNISKYDLHEIIRLDSIEAKSGNTIPISKNNLY